MDYIELNQQLQLDEIDKLSQELENGVLIFKHSTRCAISKMAFDRFRRGWKVEKEKLPVFFLDLIRHRGLSNAIADRYNVEHESPQVLLIRNGECVYHTSHNGISPALVEEQMVNG